MDEELAIVYLAERGDEEAQMIRDFEDQLIESGKSRSSNLLQCLCRGEGKNQRSSATLRLLAVDWAERSWKRRPKRRSL